MSLEELKLIRENLKTDTEANAKSPAELRAGLEAACAGLQPPEGAEISKHDIDGTPAELIVAPGASDTHTILYLHGGGYVMGSINTHRNLCFDLSAASGARVLLIDYALAPEHPYPAAVEDAVKCYVWLLESGTAPKHIAIAGDSAGGGLTVAALVALRERNIAGPAAGFAISPWIDLEGLGESMTTKADEDPMVTRDGLRACGRHYLQDTDPHDPLAAPLYANLAGLPPLLIHVGTAEVLLDDATRLADKARDAGVDTTLEEWPDMIHVWHAFAPLLEEGREAITKGGAFLKSHLG